MSFGTKLKQLRKVAELTQVELAKKTGLGQSTVAGLESDTFVPTWPTVQKLCAALGVSCEVFNEPAKKKRVK